MIVAQPPVGLGREELHGVEAEVERLHDLARRADPRDHRHADLLATTYDGSAEAGRDDEPRARLDGLVDLAVGEDGAGTDDQVVVGGEAAQDRGRLRRAERRLGDGQPALHEGGAEGVRPGWVVQDDHRHDAVAAQDVCGARVHRRAHRSSAMTVLSSV